MILATIYVIIAAIFLLALKAAFGPTVWDRLLALNLISAKTVMLLTAYSVYTGDLRLLDISMSYVIVGFLGVALLSSFILRGGRQK